MIITFIIRMIERFSSVFAIYYRYAGVTEPTIDFIHV